MERHIPGGCGEISGIVTAAVALAGLAALIAGCLGQLFRFCIQKLIQSFLDASRTNSLICPLIISSLNCTMLLDMVCRLLSECV